MKKEGDKALHGKLLGLGKLHKSIIRTDVEGKLDTISQCFLEVGGNGGIPPFSLE